MTTNIYIDGFNFYYGCLKDTRYKWLDLEKFFNTIFPYDNINQIRYFTSKVFTTQNDPHKLKRQEEYLRALRTIPILSIHYGQFQINECFKPFVNQKKHCMRMAKVFDTKEKGTDVNLATYLLMDGIVNNYEKAVVVSNDGDLKIAVEVVKNTLKHEVIVMNPDRNKTKSWALKKAATKYIYVYERTLAKCQFPTILTDAHGTITKPASW